MGEQYTNNNPEKEPTKKPEVSSELVDTRLQKLHETIKTESSLQAIRSLPHAIKGAVAFLVGGSIRDAALGDESKDYDFLVRGASVDQILEHCNRYGKAILAGEKRFAVIKFYPEGTQEEIDIALPRTEVSTGSGYRDFEIVTDENLPIDEDLSRRDFTFNAMAMNVESGEVVDPHGGADDLLNGVIRFVGDPDKRLQEDLSRMLRGIRFAIKYNFSLDESSGAAIQHYGRKINEKNEDGEWKVSREKIGQEFLKMVDANPLRALDYLDDSGLLEHALPEFYRLKYAEQNKEYHPEGDVFTHTRIMLEKLPKDASIELKLSVLYHDVGKYTATQITYKKDGPHPYEPGTTVKAGERVDIVDPKEYFKGDHYDEDIHQIQNIAHDMASVEILDEMVERFSLTAEFSPDRRVDWKRVRYNVQHHLLHGVKEMRESRVEKILFDENREPRWDLVALSSADAMTDDNSRAEHATKRINEMLATYEKRANEPDTIIDRSFWRGLFGNKELVELGLKPGPVVHALGEALRDEELGGRIQGMDDAIAFIAAFLKTNKDIDWEELRYQHNPERLADMRERRDKRERKKARQKARRKKK